MAKNSFHRSFNPRKFYNPADAVDFLARERAIDPFFLRPRKFQRPTLVGGKGGKTARERGGVFARDAR